MASGIFTSRPKSKHADEASGEAVCDQGHTFRISNFHQKFIDGEVGYEITGYCDGCKNSVRVIRSEIPKGASRDYRVITSVR